MVTLLFSGVFKKKHCFLAIFLAGLSFLAKGIELPKIYHKTFAEKCSYIIQKYEKTMFEKPFLFYPAEKPKRLIIVFNGATKGKYSLFSWFWCDDEKWSDTAYLFLRDDDLTWYLGNDAADYIPHFSEIINYHIKLCGIEPASVFTLGSSMGGYAAIFYATLLGLGGVIAINPQVDKASASKFYGISRAGSRWRDLNEVVAGFEKVPNIALIYSYCPKDVPAANVLLDAFKEKFASITIRRHASIQHTISALVLSKDFIEGEIEHMSKQKLFKEEATTKSIEVNTTD